MAKCICKGLPATRQVVDSQLVFQEYNLFYVCANNIEDGILYNIRKYHLTKLNAKKNKRPACDDGNHPLKKTRLDATVVTKTTKKSQLRQAVFSS